MFGAKKKKSDGNQAGAVLNKAAQDDLIIHNMPPAARLDEKKSVRRSTKTYNPALGQAAGVSLGGRNNFKTVGVAIMVGGVIFISLVVYLSYIFIIKPVAKNQAPTVAANNQAATSQPAATSSATSSAARAANSGQTPLATTAAAMATVSPGVIGATDTTTNATASGATSSDLGLNATTTTPLVDSDSDGLNDEEEAVFGTSPNRADTDNDGYTDLSEITNGYDPTGSGKLSADQKLSQYSNTAFNYQALYPKDWAINSLDNGATIDFNAPDNSLIQISVQDNTDKQSILSWYSASFPDDTVTYDKIKSGNGWDGVMASDGFNFYLTDKKNQNIYVVSYIPAVDSRVAYPNVFQMIINSLTLK